MFGGRRAGAADVGVDLGTTTTRVVARGAGLIAELPTVVVIEDGADGRRATAFGHDAHAMLGRTAAGTRAVQPIRDGAVEDFAAAELVLRHVLSLAAPHVGARPRLLLTARTDATEVERRALLELGRAAGAAEVELVRSPLAAALGAQLPVTAPHGSMLIDLGGGRTEVAVTSLSGLVVKRSIKVAGEALDARIVQWLRRRHHAMIGPGTAERVKHEVGAARPPQHVVQIRIRARDLSTGAPKVLDLHGGHVAEAIQESVVRIRDTVLDALREVPPELSADILASGVLMVGAGCRLPGLDDVLGEATGLPILQAERPALCTAEGLLRLLDDAGLLEALSATAT